MKTGSTSFPIEPEVSSAQSISTLQTYSDESTASLVRQRDALRRDPASILIVAAARNLGADVEWIDSTHAVATHEGKRLLIAANRGRASRPAASLVTDKWLTKRILCENRIATPKGRVVGSANEAVDFFRSIGSPIVLKPRFGFGGTAVQVNLSDEERIAEAYTLAAKHGDVLAEEFVPHRTEYRCLASDTECVSVVNRVFPWVTGDGKSTIRELIEKKNEIRATIPSTHDRPIPIDEAPWV